MIIIGVDPHKRVHTATAVDAATNRRLASLEIDASLVGYRQLARWAGGFAEHRWAVENARGLGRHLAQWLVARGEHVDDVPSTATARVRELSRGGRRKNDVIDAAAAASVAALHGDANPVVAEDLTTVLALLDERRSNLTTQRTRLVNQLHALLRDLIPGGAPTRLSATAASRLLTAVRPAGPVETARKQLARDLVAEIRAADQRLKHADRRDQPDRRRDRQPADRGRRDRTGRRRPAARPHPPGQPVPDRSSVRQLRRRRTRRSRLRRPRPAPPPTRRRPAAQPRAAPGRAHPGPDARQRRTGLLRHQDRRRQDPQRSDALPETAPRRPRLATHDPRRTRASGGPGRTLGDGSDIQRGWLNPDHQLFGQVTSRARHHRLYDRAIRCLTNTEEPATETHEVAARPSMELGMRTEHVEDDSAPAFEQVNDFRDWSRVGDRTAQW